MTSYKARVIAYVRSRALRDPANQELIDGIADYLEQMPEELVERTRAIEPYFKGGAIGREVVRCGYCGQEEVGRGQYCKMCGRRLVDKIEDNE